MDTRLLLLLALCAATAEPLSEDHNILQPLEHTFKKRSDEYGTYAEDYAQESEPTAYAAIPLHQPMPVIAILSDTPLTHKQYGAKIITSPTKRHPYNKPDYQNYPPTEYNPYANSIEDYQKPYASEYQSSYASIHNQKPFNPIEFRKPFSAMDYQKNYAVDYPSYAPMEYVKPYPLPEFSKPYAPVEYARPYPPVDYSPHPQERIKPYASVDSQTILYARPNENGGYTYRRKPLKPLKPRKVKKNREPIILRVHKYRVVRDRRSSF